MSQTHYYFLPDVRQGLTTQIGSQGPHRAQVIANLVVTAHQKDSLDATDTENIPQTVQLYGAGDILGFDPRIVIRTDPKPDVGDFESNYFPAIEFADADFAWRFTPVSADSQTPQLTPWISLIVLIAESWGDKVQKEFEEGEPTDRNLPRYITVSTSALPDLNQAWRWSHTQMTDVEKNLSTETLKNDLEESLKNNPERAICRLLCARRLRPRTRYAAFVVPTYKLGLLAGLGQSLEGSDIGMLAWNKNNKDESIRLPYYYRWEFGTSSVGDFEYLVSLLEPRKLTNLGIRNVDCGQPGFGIPGVNREESDAAERHILGLEGALQSLDTTYTCWGRDPADQPPKPPEPLQVDLAKLVNETETEQVLLQFNPPVLEPSCLVIEASENDAFRLTWHTSQRCQARIDYWKDGTEIKSVSENEFKLEHELILSQLTSGQHQFTITVHLEDSAIAETSAKGTFTLPLLPSVLPPIYGRWHRGLKEVDPENQQAWFDVLNLDPRHRAAAGLGSQVIRQQQEALMASAWEQLGDIERANDLLRRSQFGRESSNPLHRRLGQLPTEDFLRLTASVQKRVLINDPDSGQTLAAAHYLHSQSRTPAAALDPAFRHIARLRGPLRQRQQAATSPNLLSRLASGNLEAAGPPAQPMGTVRLCDITRQLRDRPKINLDVSALNFGTVAIGNSSPLSVQIQNTGGTDLIITSIARTPDTSVEFTFTAPTAPFNIPASKSCPITVTYKPTTVGSDAGKLTIASSDSDKPSVELFLTGTGTEVLKPAIKLDPSQLNFGEVKVGSSLSLSAQIQNVGNAELLVAAVTRAVLTSANFTLTSLSTPFTIQAKGSAELKVKYEPWQKGIDNGALEIKSNDPTNPKVSLTLSGQAVDGPVVYSSGIVAKSGDSPDDPRLRFCEGRITTEGIHAALNSNNNPFAGIPGIPDPAQTAGIITDLLENWLDKPQPVVPQPPERPASFLMTAKEMVLSAIDPKRTLVERVKQRLSLSGDLAQRFEDGATGDPLDSIMSAPEFPQAMYEPLRDISHELLLPGVEKIPQNTIGLLQTNRRFLEAYMCGLNHEFAGELLWRGYPTDQRSTYFRQFWKVSEYIPDRSQRDGTGGISEQARETLKDIRRLTEWDDKRLGENGVRPASDPQPLVLLIRGDLLKRYPNALIYAVNAVTQGGKVVPSLPEYLDPNTTSDFKRFFPIFYATLPPDLTFLGFPFDENEARGNKFFIIEERVTDARFGLDAPNGSVPELNTWDDLSWSHFGFGKVTNDEYNAHFGIYLDTPPNSPYTPSPIDNSGKIWNSNSAVQAWITLQKPVRIAIRANQMLPTNAASSRAAEALSNQADQLVQSGFQAISQAFPGSMPTDPHRKNLCMRDLHYYLRPIIVCCQLESTVPLDNFLLPIKDINRSLGYSHAWFVTFYQSIKANHGLSGEEAVIANRYLDYAIKELG